MFALALLGVAIWLAGRFFRLPGQATALLVALFYTIVLALLVVLPETHPLHAALGGSAGSWLVMGGAGLLIYGYGRMLGRLRRAARPAFPGTAAAVPAAGPGDPAAQAPPPLSVERYARHILLREIGGPGQRRLAGADVIVAGAGGIGAPALLYLAGAGVGRIRIVDDDRVALSNLQRQVIYATADLGALKAEAAARVLSALNPGIRVEPVAARLDEALAARIVPGATLVLDGTDSFATRAAINRACVAAGVPLLSAAVTQWEGQLTLFDPARGAPCHACLFPVEPAPGLAPSCAEAGVAGPLPGVLGSMAALEAVKEITGAGSSLRGRLLLYDGLHGENRTLTIRRDPACPVCGQAR